MIVSIETPVFKGTRLQRCIDSVLYQSSPNWRYSLLWDGGDEQSRRILQQLDRRKHPNVTVYFEKNQGIARARRFLSEHSQGDYILPLDDDDALPFHAVERFLAVAEQKPWAAVVRGQRKIIDQDGKVLDTAPWFPFGPRHYQHGMVNDLMNHTQPYLISRSAYNRTTGWEGFADFGFAGEDCDLYLKLEEVGTIELLNETLYYYRVHPNRASLVLTDLAAYEMWRRLADKTIARIGLPLKRLNDRPPFVYQRLPRPAPTLSMVDFIIVAAPDGPTRSQADRSVELLKRFGVGQDALQVIGGRSPETLNQAVQRTTRPLICLLDTAIEIDRLENLDQLVRLLHEHDADLAAPKLLGPDGVISWADPTFDNQGRPRNKGAGHRDEGQFDRVTNAPWLSEKLILVRREVVNAVGGFTEGFDDHRMMVVDFCLKARQRQFKCAYIGTVGFKCRDAAPDGEPEAAQARLLLKWVNYRQLFAGQGDR